MYPTPPWIRIASVLSSSAVSLAKSLAMPGLDVAAQALRLALRRVLGEQPRRLEPGRHVGQLELDRLVLADRLAHGLALLCIGERGVEGGPRHADGTRRDVDAAHLEHAEDLGQAATGRADQVAAGTRGRRRPSRPSRRR